jgi:hypothetical protein
MLTNLHFVWKTTSVDTIWLIISTSSFPKLSDLCFFNFPLFLLVWTSYPFLWYKVVLLGVKERQLVSHSPYSKGYKKNPPELVWRRSCTTQFPIISLATLTVLRDRQVEIIGKLVSNRLPKETVICNGLVWVIRIATL